MDASTAILLAKADLLEPFIRCATARVVMPKEVLDECCARQESWDAKVIGKSVAGSRIEVVGGGKSGMRNQLCRDFNLGRGEAAAIALAVSAPGAIVATDDKRAINTCKLLGVPFTTTLSMLVGLRDRGVLDTAEALEKLEFLSVAGRYKATVLAAAHAALKR